VALAAASLVALAVPITRTHANIQDRGSAGPTLVTGDGLAAAIQSQAQVVTAVLAEAESDSAGDYWLRTTGLDSVPGAALVPRPLLAAIAQLTADGAFASPRTQASLLMQRERAVPFTLHEQGFTSPQFSAGLTVGQALAALGIDIGGHDRIWPGPDSPLSSGTHVYVQHANRIELTVAGKDRTLYTFATRVGDALAEAGLDLDPLDKVSQDASDPVRHGMRISVTTVRTRSEYTDETLLYDTVYRDDPDMLQGQEAIVQGGEYGYVRTEYQVRLENGREVKRRLVAQTVVPPTTQIIARGTGVAAPILPAPPAPGDLNCARTLSVYATWYTAASAGGSGYTALGLPVTKGVVAVDPRVIPLGTNIYVPGYGYALAADTGGAIIGNIIDLGYGPNDVYDWSTRWVDICILP